MQSADTGKIYEIHSLFLCCEYIDFLCNYNRKFNNKKVPCFF